MTTFGLDLLLWLSVVKADRVSSAPSPRLSPGGRFELYYPPHWCHWQRARACPTSCPACLALASAGLFYRPNRFRIPSLNCGVDVPT